MLTSWVSNKIAKKLRFIEIQIFKKINQIQLILSSIKSSFIIIEIFIAFYLLSLTPYIPNSRYSVKSRFPCFSHTLFTFQTSSLRSVSWFPVCVRRGSWESLEGIGLRQDTEERSWGQRRVHCQQRYKYCTTHRQAADIRTCQGGCATFVTASDIYIW